MQEGGQKVKEAVKMLEISPKEAATALGVSERIIYVWLEAGEIEGAHQSITGRWSMTIGALENVMHRKIKPRDGGRTVERFHAWVEKEKANLVA